MIILVSMILLTCKATDSFSRSAGLESISVVINETCVMEKLEQCARKLLPHQKRLSCMGQVWLLSLLVPLPLHWHQSGVFWKSWISVLQSWTIRVWCSVIYATTVCTHNYILLCVNTRYVHCMSILQSVWGIHNTVPFWYPIPLSWTWGVWCCDWLLH